jgi:hypothetical protein
MNGTSALQIIFLQQKQENELQNTQHQPAKFNTPASQALICKDNQKNDNRHHKNRLYRRRPDG